MLAVFNFGGCDYSEVVLSLPEPIELTEIFSSSGHSGNEPVLITDDQAVSVRYPQPSKEYRLTLNVNALSGILYTEKAAVIKKKTVEAVQKTARKPVIKADEEQE